MNKEILFLLKCLLVTAILALCSGAVIDSEPGNQNPAVEATEPESSDDLVSAENRFGFGGFGYPGFGGGYYPYYRGGFGGGYNPYYRGGFGRGFGGGFGGGYRGGYRGGFGYRGFG